MRFLVDMDAVIAHWGAEYDRRLSEYGEAAAKIPRTRMQVHWDLNHGRTEAEKRIIREIMCAPGFYANLTPIAGAKEALHEALRAGHDVRIVSSPFLSNPTCASDKLAWVRRHLGIEWGARTVLTNDKTLVDGDFLIDDKPDIKGVASRRWRHVLFGTYGYNMHVDGMRIPYWTPDALTRLGAVYV